MDEKEDMKTADDMHSEWLCLTVENRPSFQVWLATSLLKARSCIKEKEIQITKLKAELKKAETCL